MDTFDEWVKTTQYQCIQEWGEKVVALGASWDSFRRDDKAEIANDLVQGGIPILAARDICEIASAEVKRSTAPMAIFWDLENMPIPAGVSGRDITSSLKSILAPHGDLIQFRGYASIGLNLIPQEKRSDLQLSGCHIVDCPHNGRKEVADKMIIVDAMQFAYEHYAEGATLCFITGDVDYAYLLAVLQRHPKWRTIVISRGTMQSMLHVNCHMKMRWETDILQSIYSSSLEAVAEDQRSAEQEEGQVEAKRDLAPLTGDAFWEDDVGLLRDVIIQEGRRFGTNAPRKSQVGNVLRQTNPARFPNRDSIKAFLAKAIEKRVVVESGEGAFKTLVLTERLHMTSFSMALSNSSPLNTDELPAKTLEMAAKGLPFILFLRKMDCPSGFSPPSKAFVQSTEKWLVFMYSSHSDVSKSVIDSPWLRKGTLVDWRSATSKTCSLSICSAIYASMDGKSTCSPECMAWFSLDVATKDKAVEFTIRALEFMAQNDDPYAGEKNLRKILVLRHPDECSSQKAARLWIKEAVARGVVVSFQRADGKNKLICLPDHLDQARDEYPPEDLETPEEEQFINDLLWQTSNAGGLDRRDVARQLELKFDRMNNPFLRNKVLRNAQECGKAYLCRGHIFHIVGLTKEQAETALDVEMKKLNPEDNIQDNILSDGEENIQDSILSDGEDKSDDHNSEASMISETSSSSSDFDYGALLGRFNQSSTTNSVVTECSSAQNLVSSLASFKEKREIPNSQSQQKQPDGRINTQIDDNGNHASRNLHVSGFGPGTTKQEIYRKFKEFVGNAEVVPKGLGSHSFMFVNTRSKAEAVEARRQLYGAVVNGGPLKINFAK